MSGSQDQVGRLLALIPWLQAHPGIPTAEVAEAFGVPAAQIVKDLKVAWMCGLPGGLPDDLIEIDMDAVEGEGRIVLGNADYLGRPMRFTPDEAMSLVVALRVVAELVAGEMAGHVQSALAKLEALADGADVDRVAIRVASGGSDVRDALTSAIAGGQRVRLTYDGQTRGHTTSPVVDPARIDLRDGAAYLQAFSLDRGAWRTYRLDRIESARPTGDPAEAHGDVPAPARQWFDSLSADNTATLALDPASAWAVEYYPTVPTPPGMADVPGAGGAHEAGADAAGSEVVATFPVSDPAWLTSLLLRLGSGVRVLSPAGSAEDAVERARAALALHDAT